MPMTVPEAAGHPCIPESFPDKGKETPGLPYPLVSCRRDLGNHLYRDSTTYRSWNKQYI